MSTKRMPMVFSIRTQPAPQPAVKPAPQQSTSRFTMHDLYKVAKKGCKSCGG